MDHMGNPIPQPDDAGYLGRLGNLAVKYAVKKVTAIGTTCLFNAHECVG